MVAAAVLEGEFQEMGGKGMRGWGRVAVVEAVVAVAVVVVVVVNAGRSTPRQ